MVARKPKPVSNDPADEGCLAIVGALLRRDLFADVRTEEQLTALVNGAIRKTPKPYALLLCRLLGYDPRLDEREALAFWNEIVEHRRSLARVLGRRIHMRVAALDLLSIGKSPAGLGPPFLVGPGVLRQAYKMMSSRKGSTA